jgi:endonuclease/exonuclease/phosphatase family metal-dependent hydrolase
MGARTRAALAASIVCALAACSYDDRPSPGVWVPFAQIDGQLKPELVNAPAAPPPAGTLRVVTYNVHLGEQYAGIESAFLNDPALQQGSVLLFEEIESHPADGRSQASRLASALGMSYAYAPAWAYSDGATHGLAVLSRWPILEAEVLDLPYFDLVFGSERRIALRVTVAVSQRTARVVAIHLDTRINPNDRLEQLLPAVELTEGPCILGGDFNSNPYAWAGRVIPMLPAQAAAPIDVAGAIDQVMQSRGFSAPTAESGDTSNTFANARLDSIYLRGYVSSGFAVVREVTVSDHFPVWVDVIWPAGT